MRFISLWVNTAFSTKYGSIFITASWMGSTTRCIVLTATKPRPPCRELPLLHQPPETVKKQSAEEEEWRFQVLAHHFWVTDWLTVCEHLCCSVKKCRLFRRHTLLSLLPHLSLSECECKSDSCLEGRTAVSSRCLRHTQQCVSLPSLSLFCLCHTLLQYTR